MAGQNTVIGLDIGRHTVKAVWVEDRGGKPRITRTEVLRLPQAVGDIKPLLLPWVEQQGLTRHPCVVTVPGHSCMFQPFSLQPRDPRTPEQAAAVEVIRFNEMASEQMAYGFSTAAPNPGERMILLGMTRPTVVNELLAAARAMDMNVIDMIPSPIALFHAMEATVNSHEAPYLYAAIGHGATDVVIGSSRGLLFARSFAGGGDLFTDALAKSADMTASQAENIKLTEGSMLPGKPTTSIFTPAAELWVSEVESCLSVFSNAMRSERSRPARVILAGGGALLPGLVEHVGRRLKMEASVVEALPADSEIPRAAQFATATGLALAGLGGVSFPISLLPETVRHEMEFRRKKPHWVAAGLAAALILGISLVGGYRDANRKQEYLAQQRQSLNRRQALVSKYETLKAENERLHEISRPVKKMLRAAPAMRDLITLAANSLAARDQIVMVCDAESFFVTENEPGATVPRSMRDRRRNPRNPEDNKPPEMTFERVIIEGYTQTPNLQTVKALIEKLGGVTNFVQSADLMRQDDLDKGRTATTVQKKPGSQRFVVDVKLSPP